MISVQGDAAGRGKEGVQAGVEEVFSSKYPIAQT
jgi:hypothetical protein